MENYQIRRIVSSVVYRIGSMTAYATFIVLDYLLPKDPNSWAFCTWPGTYAHTQDNPRAIFEEVKQDPLIKKVIVRRPGQDSSTARYEGANVEVVESESVRGALMLARSKIVFLGYGLGGMCSYSKRLSKKHHIVQLWHGIPLKRIGKLFPGERHWELETPRYSACVCSSPQDMSIMQSAFDPVPQVWQTGLPRNDLLNKEEKDLPADYQLHLEDLRKLVRGRRLILYAPTWRESSSGIYPFSELELTRLETLLLKHDAVFAIRAHANRRRLGDGLDPSTCFFVDDYPDVNVILRETDVLITDYSSIYIDFLLTNRPILHFTYDLHSYVAERGFLYDLNDAFAGEPLLSADELFVALEKCLDGTGIDSERYDRAKNLFHDHPSFSSQVVVEKVKGLAHSAQT